MNTEIKPKIIQCLNKSNRNKYWISVSFILLAIFFFFFCQSFLWKFNLMRAQILWQWWMVFWFRSIKKLSRISKYALFTDSIRTIVCGLSNNMKNYYSFQYELFINQKAYSVSIHSNSQVLSSVCDIEYVHIGEQHSASIMANFDYFFSGKFFDQLLNFIPIKTVEVFGSIVYNW